MATSHLKAKVQARIDALTHPTPAFDLQQHAIDTVGLNLDLTNIKSVLNSATANIATATTDEITALNTASVALGVTINPNSIKYEINDVKPINSTKVKIIDSLGNEWIRSGWVETDSENYPDAEITAGSISAITYSFDVNTHITTARGISFDKSSNRFYIYNSLTRTCGVFDEQGNYIESTADLTTGPNASVSTYIVYNNIIYVHYVDTIYSYTTAGVYIETLPYTFSKSTLNYGNMGYDPVSNSFFLANNSGLGGPVEILYVNQTNGEAGRFDMTPSISGYTPYGVGVYFGRIFLLTYSPGQDTNRIYSTSFLNYKGEGASLFPEYTLSNSPFDNFTGITATKNGFYGVTTTNLMVKMNADIGVGQAKSESVNDKDNIFYYVRIK